MREGIIKPKTMGSFLDCDLSPLLNQGQDVCNQPIGRKGGGGRGGGRGGEFSIRNPRKYFDKSVLMLITITLCTCCCFSLKSHKFV